MKLLKHFRKAWLHILIVVLAIIYILVANRVYARYFVKQGKPIAQNIELPNEITAVKYSLSSLDVYNMQGVYHLSGWAFPQVQLRVPASDYERYVVLVSNSGNFIFQADTTQRSDIQTVFIKLGWDVSMSGLSALIYKDSMRPGTYGLGLIFKNTRDLTEYYANLDQCISITPNRIWLEDLKSAACRKITHNDGNPITVNTVLPTGTTEAKFNIENLKTLEDKEIYELSGWSFPMGDTSVPSDEYDRQVVLITGNGNYVFTAKTTTRFDVQDYFSDLGMDLTKTGFYTVMAADALDDGSYNIGLIFKRISNGEVYLVNTTRCIIRSENGLLLGDKGPTACEYPSKISLGTAVQKNVEIPAQTNKVEYWIESFDPTDDLFVYKLTGWAFPMVNSSIPIGDYERQVILISNTTNILFSAETIPRIDVQDYFNNLGLNLVQSGFSAYISKGSLETGSYRIGLIFKHNPTGTVYFINTARCISRTNKGLILEYLGSQVCLDKSP